MAATYVRDIEGRREIFRVSGTFDLECAWSLRAVLERSTAPEIVLDFVRVRDFFDIALAVLANGMNLFPRAVVVRGLGQHQTKILRYCALPKVDAAGGAITSSRPG